MDKLKRMIVRVGGYVWVVCYVVKYVIVMSLRKRVNRNG